MIDIDFWNMVAEKWITVLDMKKLEEINEQAYLTAKATIGADNESLLDLFAALDDY